MGNNPLCKGPLPDIPESTYKLNPRAVRAYSTTSSAVFSFTMENDKLTVTPKNRTLKDLIESAEFKVRDYHDIMIYQLESNGYDNETPFEVPSNFSVNYMEVNKKPDNFPFKVGGYTKDEKYQSTIITKPFNRKSIIETYGPIMEDIMSYRPMITTDQGAYIIDIDTPFYHIFYKWKEGFSNLAGESGVNFRIGLHFDVKQEEYDIKDCKSIRISTDAYKAIIAYLKTNIFDHILKVDTKGSFLSIRENEIQINQNNATKFSEKVVSLYGNSKQGNSLNCTYRFLFELFIFYKPGHIPTTGSTLRFRDPKQQIANPFDLGSRDSGLTDFINQLNELKNKKEEPKINITTPKIKELDTKETIIQPSSNQKDITQEINQNMERALRKLI